METLLATLNSPTTSDHCFQPSPEVDFTNLFEQCGIPLADLGAQLCGLQSSTPTRDSSSTSWYSGTAPQDGDLVELVDDHHLLRTKASACKGKRGQTLADEKIDGSGTDSVSNCGGEEHDLVSLQGPEHHEAADRRSSSALAEHDRLGGSFKSPIVPSRSPIGRHSNTSTTTVLPRPRSPPSDKLSSKKDDSPVSDMDFYSQAQFYSGAQLSSPVSMKSSTTGDNDSYLYTPVFSPHFSNYAQPDSVLTSVPGESEAMRRSRSTPFPGPRSITPYRSALDTASDSSYQDFPSFDQQEFVPASDHGAWERNGDYLLPRHRQQSTVYDNAATLPMSAPRPSMKRKTRPMPIATSLPRSAVPMGAQTAPLERGMMRDSMSRPQLSAKRSFEDFTELDADHADVSPYRPISTPTSKRARSTLSSSPFVDEPLFSPVYNTSGLALSMDPEQLLLSSPPYTQLDFCASPNYLSATQASLDSYVVPGAMLHGHIYNHEPLSPVDMETMWVGKSMYGCPPQAIAQPVYTTPRALNYGQSSPLRKTGQKNRGPTAARAISFCNYTAADRKTILSGVAPSGSNRKAVTKAQEMSRSRSSGAAVAA